MLATTETCHRFKYVTGRQNAYSACRTISWRMTVLTSLGWSVHARLHSWACVEVRPLEHAAEVLELITPALQMQHNQEGVQTRGAAGAE